LLELYGTLPQSWSQITANAVAVPQTAEVAKEEFVSVQVLRKLTIKGVFALACLGLLTAGFGLQASSQDETARKIKSKVAPVYPDLARKMSITGTVRMKVVVSPNGTMKDAKVVGGHPILVNAAMDAIKKWKFEPATSETTETVEFTFSPQD
jgi:TonB family protein